MDRFKKILSIIFDAAMYINAFALLPQPYQIMKSRSTLGVSAWMWFIFFIFQFAISLHGKLNLKSRAMFLGMGFSAIISLATWILCFIY